MPIQNGPGGATFVLVHGGSLGSWCWNAVADRLRQRGHRVFSPTLTGTADRAHIMSDTADLSLHIADVVNVIRFEDLTDIVLVGHSYGGMVISGVVEQVEDRTRALVFLDAILPRNGESTLDQLGVAPGQQRPMPSAAAFNVDPAFRAAVDAHITPQPPPSLTEPIRLTGARERISRRIFVAAPDWPGYGAITGPVVSRIENEPGWTIRKISCGHVMMIDKPDETAALLLEAAA